MEILFGKINFIVSIVLAPPRFFLILLLAVNPATFGNAKFDALIGKDVMKQLLGLFFDLSSGIVSIGKMNVPQGAHMFNRIWSLSK